jgi:hypothetical protein
MAGSAAPKNTVVPCHHFPHCLTDMNLGIPHPRKTHYSFAKAGRLLKSSAEWAVVSTEPKDWRPKVQRESSYVSAQIHGGRSEGTNQPKKLTST